MNTDDGTPLGPLGTVVICTALDDEYRAVREHLTGPFHEREERGTLYEEAIFPANQGHWTVVLTQTSAGNTQAGVQLERARRPVPSADRALRRSGRRRQGRQTR